MGIPLESFTDSNFSNAPSELWLFVFFFSVVFGFAMLTGIFIPALQGLFGIKHWSRKDPNIFLAIIICMVAVFLGITGPLSYYHVSSGEQYRQDLAESSIETFEDHYEVVLMEINADGDASNGAISLSAAQQIRGADNTPAVAPIAFQDAEGRSYSDGFIVREDGNVFLVHRVDGAGNTALWVEYGSAEWEEHLR